jgi:hypothetical protein
MITLRGNTGFRTPAGWDAVYTQAQGIDWPIGGVI